MVSWVLSTTKPRTNNQCFKPNWIRWKMATHFAICDYPSQIDPMQWPKFGAYSYLKVFSNSASKKTFDLWKSSTEAFERRKRHSHTLSITCMCQVTVRVRQVDRGDSQLPSWRSQFLSKLSKANYHPSLADYRLSVKISQTLRRTNTANWSKV